MSETLTACVIAQDEEERLPECLASLEFCDQVAGNSTPSWRNEPTAAVRVSHSTVSNGCTPGWVKRRWFCARSGRSRSTSRSRAYQCTRPSSKR